MQSLHRHPVCPLASAAPQVRHAPAFRRSRQACRATCQAADPAQTSGPADLTTVKDANDGYEFGYPFGWQEVSVKGQDIVFKDLIEPLESVSVSISPTDKKTVEEFGPLGEVALTLASNVLTPPKQEVKILNVGKRKIDGREYYDFEFASKANTYIRHALASVTVGNGKFYTLTTGANEKRWSKMKERLEDVIASFHVSDRYLG